MSPAEPRFEAQNQSPALPVQPGERIVFVDILRGFAIFGILVANMAGFSGHAADLQGPLAAIDRWVLILIRFFITAKFYSLFSFLFGWGLSVQMARARERGTGFTSLYLRRLLILLLFGIVHGVLIWSGDILTIYAFLGFLLFLTRNRSGRTILILAGLCLLLSILLKAPWQVIVEAVSRYENLTTFLRLELAPPEAYASGSYLEITRLRLQEYLGAFSSFLFYFGNIFSMFLLGLWTGKRRMFREADQHVPLLYQVMAGVFLLGVLGNGLNVWLTLHPGEMPATWLPQGYHRMLQQTAYTIGAPALMLFYVSGMILILRKKYWQSVFSPLANVGRMALSNYLFQSILATLIFYNYGLGLYGEISPFVGLILTVVIFLTQVRISEWWFDRYRYGPLEWIWRFLTYGRSPQSLSASAGRPGELSVRFERLCRSIKGLHPAWILSLTWVALLVWAGLLILWNHQIGVKRQEPILRLIIAETAVPTNQAIQPGDGGQAAEAEQKSNPVFTFPQGPYHPGKIAASGDVEALVGTFVVQRAVAEIETLTGAPYWGRQAGSPQGLAAGDYIASQFSRYGLQPLGDHGAYFQEFSVLYTPLEDTPRLYMELPAHSFPEEFIAYQDFTPVVRWYAGSGVGKGRVYWMNRCAEDDFAAMDVVGKVLMCLPDPEPDWLEQLSRRALEHGAAALLFLTDPEIRPPDFGWSFKEIWVPEPLPVFFVYPEMVSRLLTGSEKTLSDLRAHAQPFPLESTAGFEIQTRQSSSCPGTECIARNVIGILPGRDPTYAREAIILGAHYDHMGQTPNGIVWPGANDDASGVAVLLEIARSWNEQGYIPKRSVIFIAWDAEEQGLLGAIHYVENPPFPLANTAAMIQLDMVGAGLPALGIDGTTSLGEKIKHIAETLGVEARISNTGGSDHVPFLTSGIPASALIWELTSGGEIGYHLPSDNVQNIDGERLRTAGQIAELAVLNLVESEPSIREMLAARARAAQDGDLAAFLSTSHPDQIQNDRYWFEDLLSLQPEQVSLEAENLLIAGNLATASVQIEVSHLEPSENTTRTLAARIPVAFAFGSSGWQWSSTQQVWSELETSPDGSIAFKVGCPPGKENEVAGAGLSAIEKYQRLTNILGLPPEIQARLLVLANEEALWGSTALSQPRNQTASVIPGEVRLVFSEAISTSLRLQDSLAQLALAEAGVGEDLAPWLWQGLPLVLQGYDQPISTQIKFMPTLEEDLAKGSPPAGPVSSWAATAYLQERLGWSGLGRFIMRLGQLCQDGCNPERALDAALLEFVSMDVQGFEIAWQSTWQLRLETAQGSINTLLSNRSQAFSSGDKQLLLDTIDRGVPNLETEEIHWMEDFQYNPPQDFSIRGRPLAFLEGGGLLAEITLEYQYAGKEGTSTSFNILLTPSEAGYHWAGMLVERLSGARADILYPGEKADLAAALLVETEQIYARLASVLDVPQVDMVVIKLYETPASYRASISMSQLQTIAVNAWTMPGESIKLNIAGNDNPENYAGDLAEQLSRSLLYQSGVEAEWLVEGISAFLSRPYDVESSAQPSGLQIAELVEAVRTGAAPVLNNALPTTQISRNEVVPGKNIARDAVDFLISNYGWPVLLEILAAQDSGTSLDDAFQSSLGITLGQFEQNWHTSLLQKHVRPEWVETAQVFIPGFAMESVDYLASPALEGRLAGSPGSAAAAQYIAKAFKAYGLLPAGNPITDTTALDNPVPGAMTAYFQTFPISYTDQTSIPDLGLLNGDGELVLSLTFRQDFLLVQSEACAGMISAPLVWGGDQAYPEIDLEGKIILRTRSQDLQGEISAATSRGAAGLIVTRSRREPEELFAKQPATSQDSSGASIPVFEISQPGYSRLLDALGHDRQSIARLPVFQPLGVRVRLDCNPYHFETVQAANVLGLLPGSDPYLRQDVIILGAHYDYVGDDPGGLRYSGANDNASGVAVLLEIARLLHEQDYRPKRSLLFAAWGAQELGEIGSNYYITNPIFPLHDTIAMIQLDSIGGGGGFNLGIQSSADTEGEVLFYLSAAEEALQEKLVYSAQFNESDDAPFRRAGIPAVLVSWRLANDDNLPDELGSKVLPERLGVAGRVITLLLLALAR